jgi:hypothetical protein
MDATETLCTTCQDPRPRRIQRRRTKDWRIPEGAVYVGRPTKWGNPFYLVDVLDAFCGDEQEAREDCVRSYRRWLHEDEAYVALASTIDARRELRGRDLACWCRLDQPCHADVLLEIANNGDVVCDVTPPDTFVTSPREHAGTLAPPAPSAGLRGANTAQTPTGPRG